MPGLGYAKLSLTERERLSLALSDYLEQRQQLNCLVHLLDCRRDPNPEDIELSQQFRSHVPNYLVVMTKIDQIPISKRRDTQKRFIKILGIAPEHCLAASASEHIGRDAILLMLSQFQTDSTGQKLIEDFIEKRQKDSVTEALNKLYAKEDSKTNLFVHKANQMLLGHDEW